MSAATDPRLTGTVSQGLLDLPETWMDHSPRDTKSPSTTRESGKVICGRGPFPGYTALPVQMRKCAARGVVPITVKL